jgi:hypothetical protein
MFARISTQLACTENQLWQKIVKPESLRFVASPILAFVPIEPGVLDRDWEIGRNYALKLYLLNFIPLGRHIIQLVIVDRQKNFISSRENGLLVPVWNHNITFQEIKPGLVNYTDEIEIRAGWLTPLIWFFAHLFYRHRQRRWKVLLRSI